MGDLLSSASVLLTLIALLYSLWYQEIVQAIDTEVPVNKQDRKPAHKRVKGVYSTKARPLTVAAFILTVVFAPDTVRILCTSVKHASEGGLRSILDYNAVSSSLVLVTVGSGFFTWHLFSLASDLSNKVKDLDPT
jgi:hypothetical protein